MYDLPRHKENDEQVLDRFIDEHPFAFLMGCDPESRPIATQIPILMEERGGRRLLSGHMMKDTDHHRAFLENENVLVVFTGNHTYVSGSWYDDPNLPSTWNYMSVHAKGIIRFLDEAGLEGSLRKTSLRFEDHDERSPTVFDNLTEDFKHRFMGLIAAFEIEVTSLDSVFKLSQDRDIKSYHNIIDQLERQGADGRAIASEMKRRAAQVFPEE